MTDEPPDLVGLSDHAKRNRSFWNELSDSYQAEHGPHLAIHGAAWGVWQIPESEVGALGNVAGLDVLELGCGAAQWSIALAQLGARPVGLDVSERQLEHARRLMADAGVDFPLVHGSAEAVPFPDASFDLIFCDHGAMVFADPYRTVPEAARLLRTGGQLVFSMHTPIAEICWPADSEHVTDRLAVDYFDLHVVDVGESEHVEFQLTYGAWIRLFRANGFEIEDLIELRPALDAVGSYRTDEDRAWARRWPMEHIWKVRRR
jgi:SAM-dependent methyltransferase